MSDTPKTDALLDQLNNTARYSAPEQVYELMKRALAKLEFHSKKLETELRAATTWNGSDRRCEHSMKWIRDWYGDPSIPNGTADCSRLECEQCGWIDPNGEKPERDYGV